VLTEQKNDATGSYPQFVAKGENMKTFFRTLLCFAVIALCVPILSACATGVDGVKGDKGDPGIQGERGEPGAGTKGDKGDTGKSAYDLWLELGYVGDINVFFAWLRGDDAIHIHEFDEWGVFKKATKQSVGEERRYCTHSSCDEYESREIPMLSGEITEITTIEDLFDFLTADDVMCVLYRHNFDAGNKLEINPDYYEYYYKRDGRIIETVGLRSWVIGDESESCYKSGPGDIWRSGRGYNGEIIKYIIRDLTEIIEEGESPEKWCTFEAEEDMCEFTLYFQPGYLYISCYMVKYLNEADFELIFADAPQEVLDYLADGTLPVII
jgi:hypothetical protein